MCFSATASLTAGTVLLAAGIACAIIAPERRALPLAIMPALFGIQQLTEGGLWLALHGGDTASQACFASGFSLFSQVLWPLYVPFAVWAAEPVAWRRRRIVLCGVLGAIVALPLLYGLSTGPVLARIEGLHIHYRSEVIDQLYNAGLFVPMAALYVAATCASFVIASDARIRLIGGLMGAAFAVSFVFYETWLVSVWCFFAAILSLSIWQWVRQRQADTIRWARS